MNGGLRGITAVKDYYRDANTWSVANGYQKANQDAFLPRATFSNKNERCQTRYLMNAAYMRLKIFKQAILSLVTLQ